MIETGRLVGSLKQCLKAKGITYARVATALGISEASVKRSFSRGSFTLERLVEVLAVAEMDLYELARISRGPAPGPTRLSLDQESALAEDERLLSVFWLLLNDWTFEAILAGYAISRAELTAACARLDRLKLVDYGLRNRVTVRVARDFEWRPAGPVKRAYGNRVMHEFLHSRFDGTAETLRFETREMSLESAALLRRRAERLVSEFNELAELDTALGDRRTGVAMLVATRPWRFSVVNALKRRQEPGRARTQPSRRASKP